MLSTLFLQFVIRNRDLKPPLPILSVRFISSHFLNLFVDV